MTWSDERLDGRFARIDERFDRVDHEIAALRVEMREGFTELRGQMHLTMLGMLGTMSATLVAVVAHAF